MPQYQNSGTGSLAVNPVLPVALWPGDDAWLLGTSTLTPGVQQKPTDANVVLEAVTVGERSLACVLASRPGGGAPPSLMVFVIASANPGAAEIDVQDSGTDSDGGYQTPTGSTAYKITTWTALTDGSGKYVGWTELSPEAGRFISLKVIANPNAVNFAAKVSYS